MSGRRRRQAEMDAEAYQATATERQWQETVIACARALGWVAVHFPLMGRPDLGVGNPRGFPDLLLLRGQRYVLAELKTATGQLSADQRRFHAQIAAAGGTVRVWRPADWPEVEETLR